MFFKKSAKTGKTTKVRKARLAPKPKKKIRHFKPGERPISLASEDAEDPNPISQWMIPATDAHGHSAKVFTRCPPSYKHQIGTILQSHRYPWDNESDLVRVAVHRLLMDVSKDMKDPQISSQQAILNSLVEMASRQMEYAHYRDTLDKLETTVKELLEQDAKPMARQMVEAVMDQIENFELKFWKDRYKKRIVDQFGGLLK